MKQDEKLDKSKIEGIVERIICETIGRLYPNEVPISNFFEIENKEALKSLDFSKYTNELLQKYTL